jgi:hypothetical protein
MPQRACGSSRGHFVLVQRVPWACFLRKKEIFFRLSRKTGARRAAERGFVVPSNNAPGEVLPLSYSLGFSKRAVGGFA